MSCPLHRSLSLLRWPAVRPWQAQSFVVKAGRYLAAAGKIEMKSTVNTEILGEDGERSHLREFL